MNRSEKLKQYCEGRKKAWVAKQKLGISPQMMTYLFACDIDDLISRIDALVIDEAAIPARRKRAA